MAGHGARYVKRLSNCVQMQDMLNHFNPTDKARNTLVKIS